jgi:hypothetical protein
MQAGKPFAHTLESPKFCGLCGRPVPIEDCKIDEEGNTVHPHCYVARLKREQESKGKSEK